MAANAYQQMRAAVARDPANDMTNRNADVATALDQAGNEIAYEQGGAAPPGAVAGPFSAGPHLFHGITTSGLIILFLLLAYWLYKGELKVRAGFRAGPVSAGGGVG